MTHEASLHVAITVTAALGLRSARLSVGAPDGSEHVDRAPGVKSAA